jgi:CHAT domain-containing protein
MKCFLLRLFLVYGTVISILAGSSNVCAVQFSNLTRDSLSKALNNKGCDYAESGNYVKAGELILKSIKIYASTNNPDRGILGARYLNLGSITQKLGYTDSSLQYYSVAVGYLKAVRDSHSDLAVAYLGIGNCHMARNNYHEAVSYLKQAVSILSSQVNPDYFRLIVGRYTLTNALVELGSYNEAILLGEENIVLANNHDKRFLAMLYNGLGNFGVARQDYVGAYRYYKLAEHSISRGDFLNREDVSSVYNNLGLLFIRENSWRKAEFYLTKSLTSFSRLATSNSVNVAQVINNIGIVKKNQNKFREAICSYEKALGVLRKPLGKQHVTRDKIQYFSPSLAATLYQDMGDAYLSIYGETGSRSNVVLALNCYKQSIALVEDLRLGLLGEEDKLAVSDRYNDVFNKAVGAALELAKTNSSYVYVAFQIASKGKAAVLSESLRKFNGLSLVGVPLSLQTRELQMRQRIGTLSEIVYEEKKKSRSSSKYLKSIELELFDEQEDYRKLLSRIELEYPQYYALKYDTSSVSISSIQERLTSGQVYVEYVIQDSNIYSFAITKNQVVWKAQSFDKEFRKNISVYQNELVPVDFGKLNGDNLSRFVESSSYLYNKLLKPFEKLFLGKTLVVVPHNELASIPFSALVTSKPQRLRGYYALPYLIKSNPVLVLLSAKEFVNKDSRESSLFASSLSVAPSYKGAVGNTLSSRSAYRNNLPELYGAEEEVKWVSKVFGGDIVVGSDASESFFKKVAGNYDVLHLAMHTFVDEANPLFSKLIFNSSIDSANDSFLNAYEVYGMRLNAQLAILSACRSGDGTMVKGEGLMSLARGFRYAGCPSMVVTQWRVDDFSGGEVMKQFAVGLKAGYSKSYAIQQAQLEFLNTSDPLRAHPYFWAGYQVVGADDPVFISVWNLILPLVVGLFNGIWLLGFWRKKSLSVI